MHWYPTEEAAARGDNNTYVNIGWMYKQGRTVSSVTMKKHLAGFIGRRKLATLPRGIALGFMCRDGRGTAQWM